MLENFFILGGIPANAEYGKYSPLLVILSYLIASLASYSALDFTGYIIGDSIKKGNRKFAHIAGAFVLGGGIWSMHFVGMLSYETDMLIEYNPLITVFSMAVAILSAYFALHIAKSRTLTTATIIKSSLILGSGICAMHYTGMAAMEMDAYLRYTSDWFITSIVIAITASAIALWIIFYLARFENKYSIILHILAASVLGAAICGMHYAGMKAAVFIPFADCRYDPNQSFMVLALFITAVTFFIIGVSMFFTLGLYKFTLQKAELFPARLFYISLIATVILITWITKNDLDVYHQLRNAQVHIDNAGLSEKINIQSIAKTTYYTIFITFSVGALVLLSWMLSIRTIYTWQHNMEVSKDRLNSYIEEVQAAQLKAMNAQKEAEKSTNAKSDFLANMSHEIRTPMNGVLGMTELLLNTELTGEQRSWAEIIAKSGENLLSLINDILDFSKIEAGKLELEEFNFNLHNTIEGATDIMHLKTQEKKLELLAEFAPDVPKYVIGDPIRIRQILINLISNAVKFTEQGHVLIRVKSKKEKKKVRLYFEVEDTGIGIQKDKLDYIFNKFSQAEESTTRRFGGTGLGLAISKKLSEMMGGSIGVKSKFGKGSTFFFDILLPLGKKEDAENAMIPDFDLRGIRAIVIDDYAINQEILSRYLGSWGMICDVFSSAEEALTASHKAYDEGKPYEIALVDYRLGGISGLEFSKRIKKDKKLKEKLLVMITSAGVIAPIDELKDSGLSGFLMKPFYPEQLKALLQIVLEAKRKGKEADKLVTKHMITSMMYNERDLQKELKQFKGKRVLAVEDVKVNMMLIMKLLEKHGCTVETATNGKEAVAMTDKNSYDIVFMDCQMPEMDGFEATKAIRRKEKNKHTIIVALTADAMTGDRDKCLTAGMDDYLNKPVRQQDITMMLDKWLG